MKMNFLKAVFVMAFGLLATDVLAIGGGGGSDSTNRRGQTCQASDHGFEEHGSGHSSCESCLSQHGGCTMRCYEEEYRCTATGTDRDGRSVTGSGSDYRSERRARQDAEDRCYDRGGRDCYATCTSDRDLVNSYDCGRGRDRDRDRDRRNRCSASDYLNQRPDVRANGMGACTHYTRHGRDEGMCNPC